MTCHGLKEKGANAKPATQKSSGSGGIQWKSSRQCQSKDAEGIRVENRYEIEKALKQRQQLNRDGKTVLIDVIANIEGRRSKF